MFSKKQTIFLYVIGVVLYLFTLFLIIDSIHHGFLPDIGHWSIWAKIGEAHAYGNLFGP